MTESGLILELLFFKILEKQKIFYLKNLIDLNEVLIMLSLLDLFTIGKVRSLRIFMFLVFILLMIFENLSYSWMYKLRKILLIGLSLIVKIVDSWRTMHIMSKSIRKNHNLNDEQDGKARWSCFIIFLYSLILIIKARCLMSLFSLLSHLHIIWLDLMYNF